MKIIRRVPSETSRIRAKKTRKGRDQLISFISMT
jgi:hypothetical protein